MYTIFKDLVSQDFIVSSSNSIEYPDYLSMVESGHMKEEFHGTKKKCNKYLEESLEIA